MRITLLPAALALLLAPAALEAQNAGLTLPPGFTATIFADSAGDSASAWARHIVVAANGDVIAATRRGALVVMRDADGDGRAETVRRTRVGRNGNGIALAGGYLYFAGDSTIVRWAWPAGTLEPAGPPDTVVAGLLARRQHAAKSIAVTDNGVLYVNIGAPSNACQQQDRQAGSPGRDPCTLLDSAGGIWRFDAGRRGQTQADGRRFSTGLRNVVALALDGAGVPHGLQHGRDDLHRLHPTLFTERDNAEKPAEELFRFEDGADYGWPYCYFDGETGAKVLAPEYGGDGRAVGRCAGVRAPLAFFPAHWAPNALLFYTGRGFPAEYRGGVFIAFHGSWNRAPLPQQGYNVVFQPLRDGRPSGPWRVFADGFRPEGATPATTYRPTGLALAPDGSLFVSDDRGGRIYRIAYTGRP